MFWLWGIFLSHPFLAWILKHLLNLSDGFQRNILGKTCSNPFESYSYLSKNSLKSNQKRVKMSNLIGFNVTKMMHIFWPAYYGNEITQRSSSVTKALYMTNWVDADKSYKKNLLIAIEMMKKPIKLTALYVFDINLDNFVFVSKRNFKRVQFNTSHLSSFSYFLDPEVCLFSCVHISDVFVS